MSAHPSLTRIIHIGPPISNGISSCRPTHCQREWSISAHPLLMGISQIGPLIRNGMSLCRPTHCYWELSISAHPLAMGTVNLANVGHHWQREWSMSAHPLLMEIIRIGPPIATGNYLYWPTHWQWDLLIGQCRPTH